MNNIDYKTNIEYTIINSLRGIYDRLYDSGQ